MLRYQDAIGLNDHALIAELRAEYKKQYRDYSLGIIEPDELASMTSAEQDVLEKDIDETSDMVLQVSVMLMTEDDEEVLAQMLDEFMF